MIARRKKNMVSVKLSQFNIEIYLYISSFFRRLLCSSRWMEINPFGSVKIPYCKSAFNFCIYQVKKIHLERESIPLLKEQVEKAGIEQFWQGRAGRRLVSFLQRVNPPIYYSSYPTPPENIFIWNRLSKRKYT